MDFDQILFSHKHWLDLGWDWKWAYVAFEWSYESEYDFIDLSRNGGFAKHHETELMDFDQILCTRFWLEFWDRK